MCCVTDVDPWSAKHSLKSEAKEDHQLSPGGPVNLNNVLEKTHAKIKADTDVLCVYSIGKLNLKSDCTYRLDFNDNLNSLKLSCENGKKK